MDKFGNFWKKTLKVCKKKLKEFGLKLLSANYELLKMFRNIVV